MSKAAALDRRLVEEVRSAASGRLLVAFDLDGTLAPIVRPHRAARLRPTTLLLLQRVAERYPTVVLTGRSRRDAAGRLRGIRLAAIVGNHGLEGRDGHAGARACVRRWKLFLLPRLWTLPGLEVEDKGETLSIHFRGARNPAAARRHILRAVAALSPRPRVVGGKQLVNVVPDVGVHKGTALAVLMRRHRARALYVGDDVTDEDVFALPPSLRVVTVHVGRRQRTRARYRIAAQKDVDSLLLTLLEARTA